MTRFVFSLRQIKCISRKKRSLRIVKTQKTRTGYEPKGEKDDQNNEK